MLRVKSSKKIQQDLVQPLAEKGKTLSDKEDITKTGKVSQSDETRGYKPPFESVVCELHSIDFEERTIALCVPKRIMEYGIHAGSLTIDFRPITE